MIRFNVPSGQRYMFLICIALLCYLIGSVFVGIIFYNGLTPARMTIGMVVQDVVMFVLPALVTAMIITRRPADFLLLRRKPGWLNMFLVLLLLLASVPVMNLIIEWNKGLSLPDALGGVEQWMRVHEARANELTGVLIKDGSVACLVMAVLTIGVLAGFSEELFFRGALQQTVVSTPVNPHLAIWISAFIFSAVHMQFFGFVPRLLLGALFGYLALWSGSVWLAVAAHVFNNIMAAVSMWLDYRGDVCVGLETIGAGGSSVDWVLVACSAVAVVVLLSVLYRRLVKRQ